MSHTRVRWMLEVLGKRADDRDVELIVHLRHHLNKESLELFYLGNDTHSMEAQ